MTKYRVNLYVVAVVGLDVEADTPEEAAEEAASDSMRIDKAIMNGKASYGEEIDGALVDIEGDEDNENSVYLSYDVTNEKFVEARMAPLEDRLRVLARHEEKGRKEVDAARGRRWMYPPTEDEEGPFSYGDSIHGTGVA